MTPEQTATLKAALLSDQALAQYIIDYRDDLIRDYYNAPASPAYIVWRTSVSQDEIMLNGFDWTRVDNLSVGAARVWQWMFDNAAKSFNPSKPNIRAGIDQVWKGTSADNAVNAVVYTHCKRSANRVERLFASGTGSTAVPGLMTFEGTITTSDVSAMLSGER